MNSIHNVITIHIVHGSHCVCMRERIHHKHREVIKYVRIILKILKIRLIKDA